MERLELSNIAALESKPNVSTNFTTSAVVPFAVLNSHLLWMTPTKSDLIGVP